MFTSGSMIGIRPWPSTWPRNLELLLDDRGDAFRVGEVDHRPLLGPEHAEALARGEQRIEVGHRLHQLDAVGLRLESLVDLDERHDPWSISACGVGLPVDLPVHRPLEQDRADAPCRRRSRAR